MNDVINIGGAKEYRIIDLANMIIKHTNSSSKIIHLPELKEGDMKRRMPDNSKMINILERKMITLEEGIDRMINSEDFVSLCAQ